MTHSGVHRDLATQRFQYRPGMCQRGKVWHLTQSKVLCREMCLPVPGSERKGRSRMDKGLLESFRLCGKMLWDPHREEKLQCFLHESSWVSLWECLWPSLWPPPPPSKQSFHVKEFSWTHGKGLCHYKQEESDKWRQLIA